MARVLHIVLVWVLMLQCSPLCSCALDEALSLTTDTSQAERPQPVAVARSSTPDCRADRDDSRNCPCFCANATKVAIPFATKSAVVVSHFSLQSVMFGDFTHAANLRLSDAVLPSDPFAAQSLPRLN